MLKTIGDKRVFTLLEVTKSIEKTIAQRYQSTFWVTAEMIRLNPYKQSGHCYPDLVEKRDGKVISQLSANLWASDYVNINKRFLDLLKEPLKDGIKILFLARITYHSVHGLSLNILDIDPSYTLGDLEKEKQETITRLKKDGVYDQNKSLKLAKLPQRIAIISVETSKGYEDFMSVLNGNSWNYAFFCYLFPSILQGDKAVSGIVGQLERIKKVLIHFDAVAIIRGGGGEIGLSSFNHYELSKAIAEFPLPVITGIGHTANETVSEMVSFYNAITPTKLAEFLIQKFHNFSVPLKDCERKVFDLSKRILRDAYRDFENAVRMFRAGTRNLVSNHKHYLRNNSLRLQQHSIYFIRNEERTLQEFNTAVLRGSSLMFKNELQSLLMVQSQFQVGSRLFLKETSQNLINFERGLNNLHPDNVLKRGYSITFLNGKAVKGIADVKAGDIIESRVIDGVINSEVKSKGSR